VIHAKFLRLRNPRFLLISLRMRAQLAMIFLLPAIPVKG
jgi:hypothetical protein